MRAALLAALALTAGCEVYSHGPCGGDPPGCVGTCEECLGEPWRCDESSGEWGKIFCDPAFLDVTGTIELTQTVTGATGACPAELRTDPLLLQVVDGWPKTVSADPPVVVTESTIEDGTTVPSIVWVTLVDDWGNGVTPTVAYDLLADEEQAIAGTATATHASGCEQTLAVTGTWGL